MVRAVLMSNVDAVDGVCLSNLSHKQGIWLSFVAQSGLISATAVVIFLCLVLRNYIRNIVHPPPGKWRLIRTHIDAYMLSLLFSDLLQGLGAMMTAKWAIEQQTYCSSYCTAQGIIQQVGETGVAISTLCITLHTFITVFFHIKPPQWVWMVALSGVWLFLGGYIGITYLVKDKTDSPLYAPTPFWCWLSDDYQGSRLLAEYVWIWLAAFTNIALYIPLYFCVRGNIVVSPTSKKITLKFDNDNGFWKRGKKGSGWDMIQDGTATSSNLGRSTSPPPNANQSEALKLIWYPISYTALIVPISIARWSTFDDPTTTTKIPIDELPILKTSITVFIFGLSGLVNVLVFLTTRPHILLFGARRGMLTDITSRPTLPSSTTDRSFGVSSKTADSPKWPIGTTSTYASSISSSMISAPIRPPNLTVTPPTQRLDTDIALQDLSSSSATTSSFNFTLHPPPERARRKPVTVHDVTRASDSSSSSPTSPSRSPSGYDARGVRPRDLFVAPGSVSPAKEEIGSKWVTIPDPENDNEGLRSRGVSLSLIDPPTLDPRWQPSSYHAI